MAVASVERSRLLQQNIGLLIALFLMSLYDYYKYTHGSKEGDEMPAIQHFALTAYCIIVISHLSLPNIESVHYHH